MVPVPVRAEGGTRYEKEEAKVRAIVTADDTYAVVFPLRNVGTGVAELADSAYLLKECAKAAVGGGTATRIRSVHQSEQARPSRSVKRLK